MTFKFIKKWPIVKGSKVDLKIRQKVATLQGPFCSVLKIMQPSTVKIGEKLDNFYSSNCVLKNRSKSVKNWTIFTALIAYKKNR